MLTKTLSIFSAVTVLLLLVPVNLNGQSTAFSYQGRLNASNGAAASGLFDFQFRLYDADVLGSQQGSLIFSNSVPVTNGFFAVALDFGASVFTGANLWLDVQVRTNGVGSFNPFGGRHRLMSSPYAVRSLLVANGAVTSSSLADGSVTASKIAPGAVSQLGAPDASSVNALQVNTNGLVGIGTVVPAAGLDITTSASGTNMIPKYFAEIPNTSAIFTNLSMAQSVVSYGNIVAIGAGIAGSGGITLVNVSNPASPFLLFQARLGEGSFTNMSVAGSMAMTSNLLVVASFDSSTLTMISITNPSSPTVLTQIQDGVGIWDDISMASGVAISGNLLAVGSYSDQAVSLIDISNPANPLLRSVIKQGQFGFTNFYSPTKIALDGDLLAVASDYGGVTLINVSNPSNPSKSYELPGQDSGLALANNILAISTNNYLSAEIGLLNVSSPAAPSHLGTILIPDVQAPPGGFRMTMRNNQLVIGNPVSQGQVVFSWDISNPAQPKQTGVANANYSSGVNLLAYLTSLTFAGTNLAVVSDGGFTIMTFVPQPTGILSDGWVGIGTRTTRAPLHVVGGVLVEGADFLEVHTGRIQLGGGSTSAAEGATAIGFNVTAGSQGDTALGDQTTAVGGGATAMGFLTTASGSTSTAMGNQTDATGSSSTAMGRWTTASGSGSTAMGSDSVASGSVSTAMGNSTIASGSSSLAAGYQTKARSYGETTFGLFSLDYTPYSVGSFDARDRLFVIGNGSPTPANALTMLKSGFMGFGSVTNPVYRIELPNTPFPSGQARANAWVTYSDARLKEPLETCGYGLDAVLRLQPRTYVQHGGELEQGAVKLQGEGIKTIGFVAQEVQSVVPEAVNAPDDESKDFWSLDYQKLIPVLTKAIQELKAENDELRRRVEALEFRNGKPNLPNNQTGPGEEANAR